MCQRSTTRALLASVLLFPFGYAHGQVTQVQSDWLIAADGDWTDPANWSSTDFPDNAGFTFYDALIDAAGSPYTVTLHGLIVDVDSLILDSADATLLVRNTAVLSADTIDLLDGTLQLNNGRIKDAVITAVNGQLVSNPGDYFYLEGITLASDLSMTHNSFQVEDGLTLTGGAVVDLYQQSGHNGRGIEFSGSSAGVAGDGTLSLHSERFFYVAPGGTATFGVDTAVDVLGGDLVLTGGHWINNGTLLAQGNGADFSADAGSDSFTNAGLLVGFNNAYLQFNTNWQNTGTIRLHDTAYLMLDGTYGLDDFGTIEVLDGATVALAGRLLMQAGEVFELDGNFGDLELAGVVFENGRVRAVGDNTFGDIFSAGFDATVLQDIEFNGGNITVHNGLELDNASIGVGHTSSSSGNIWFVGNQSITGNGSIRAAASTSELRFSDGHTIFESGVTIEAMDANFEIGTSSSNSWENQGTIHIGAGRWAEFLGVWTNTGDVLLDDGALLMITGDFQTSDLGTLIGTSDAVVRFHHNTDWENTGQTIDFSAVFGDLQLDLAGSRIFGGTLASSQPFDFEPSVLLNNVTVDFDWDMRAHPNRGPVVEGDLNVASGRTITLSTNGQLRWDGVQPYTFSGGGTVMVTGDETMEIGGDGLVIGAGVTVQNGDSLGIGPDLVLNVQTNHGTIFQNASTRTLQLDGSGQANHGTLRARIGTLHADTLTNTGLVEADDATGRVVLLGTTINSGTLRAVDGGVLELDQLNNTGQLEIMAGGQATLAGVWNNTGGTIHVDQGRLILGTAPTNPGTLTQNQGTFRLGYDLHVSDLSQILQSAGSTIEIAGTLDLTGSVLAMDQHPAQFVLVGGRIAGNRQINGDTPLWAAPSDDGSPSILDDVALLSDLGLIDGAAVNLVGPMNISEVRMFGDGQVQATSGSVVTWQRAELETTFELQPGSDVQFSDTFRLDGELRTSGSTGSSSLRFGVGPITGTGLIVMSRAVEWKLIGPLTLGSGIEARFVGSDAVIAGDGAALVNNGSLDILAGSEVIASVGSFISNGEINVTGGSTLRVNAALFEVGYDLFIDGTVESSGSDLRIIGDGALIGRGTVDLDGSHRLEVGGTLSVSSGGIGLAIDGDLLIQPGGRFEANPLTLDTVVLQATGDAQLGGTLALQTDSLIGIALGDEIALIQADSVTDSFSQISGLGISGLLSWSIRYEDQSVIAYANVTGDANGDHIVGVEDLDLLLAQWDTPVAAGDSTLGDLDGDGWVGQSDLDLVIAGWGVDLQLEPSVPEPGSLIMLGCLAVLLPRRNARSAELQRT